MSKSGYTAFHPPKAKMACNPSPHTPNGKKKRKEKKKRVGISNLVNHLLDSGKFSLLDQDLLK